MGKMFAKKRERNALIDPAVLAAQAAAQKHKEWVFRAAAEVQQHRRGWMKEHKPDKRINYGDKATDIACSYPSVFPSLGFFPLLKKDLQSPGPCLIIWSS